MLIQTNHFKLSFSEKDALVAFFQEKTQRGAFCK